MLDCMRNLTIDGNGAILMFHGKMILLREGWRSEKNHCTEHHKEKDIFTYSQGWKIL